MPITASNSRQLVWDIETDSLTPKHLWCLSVVDIETDVYELFTDHDPRHRSIADAVALLEDAHLWAGHNLEGFDIPAMAQLGYNLKRPPIVVDTLITSEVLYPAPQNFKFPHRCPKNLAWSHSLGAWGYRLGDKKIEFNDYSQYTPDMGKYCVQDARLNARLYKFLRERADTIGVPWEFSKLPAPLAIEHKFKYWVMRQQSTGFHFNEEAAIELAKPLIEEQEDIKATMQEVFPPITETIHYETKVRKEKKTKQVTKVFLPSSRKQIGERLVALGWEPPEFTDTGLPAINDTTMEHAASVLPEAKVLGRYFQLQKYLGMIIQGNNAWIRLARDGKIHGQVNTLGAITTRVSHNKPNLSQVPSVDSWLGLECRGLFSARPGWRLVGADLAGIELRCLAHYLHRWDKGEYIEHVLNGDVHTVHQKSFGLPEGKEWRSVGKRGTYCLIYGGGDWKLGWTLQAEGTRDAVAVAGKRLRANLMKSLPALKNLVDAAKRRRSQLTAVGKHFIRGIAGHPLYCRSEHSTLNTLLQSAGAQVAKLWYVLFHENAIGLGYVYGEDFETHGFFHDEIQAGSRPEIEDVIGELLCKSAIQSGEMLGFRLPTEAEYKTGYTWADTH